MTAQSAHGSTRSVAMASQGEPEFGPLVSGTAGYSRGTFFWTDYAYDDRGHDADGKPGGDVTYPSSAAPGNLADLIQLQVGDDGQRLTIRAILETLSDPRRPMIGVGLDTDDDPNTGADAVPGGQWTVRGHLGIDVLLLLSSDGGQLLRYHGGQWHPAATFSVTIDPARHTVDGSVPHSFLNPRRERWRAVGIVGYRDASGSSWVNGTTPIMDLASVTEPIFGGWQDERQAAVLAGTADAAAALDTIDFGKVADGIDEMPSTPRAPGFYALIYHSRVTLPGGELDGPTDEPTLPGHTYLGPYQPYGVYISGPLPPHPPVVVWMHGSTQNHIGSLRAWGPIGNRPPLDPVQQPFVGPGQFSVPAVVVAPLGRGESYIIRDIGEQDVLDALDDVIGRYQADADRVVLSGASTGGFATSDLGERYPDRWSAAFATLGTANETAGTGPPDPHLALRPNLRNVPFRMADGRLDFVVGFGMDSQADANEFDRLGYDYDLWLLLERRRPRDRARRHELCIPRGAEPPARPRSGACHLRRRPGGLRH